MNKQMIKDAAPLRLIDVATRAGVSLATASRSLSGVTASAKNALNMDYVANADARSLAGGAASTVGLIVHGTDQPVTGHPRR